MEGQKTRVSSDLLVGVGFVSVRLGLVLCFGSCFGSQRWPCLFPTALYCEVLTAS